MKLDLSKYEQNENGHWIVPTREGYDAIIFTDKSPGTYPIAGFYRGSVRQWRHNGCFYGDSRHSPADLQLPKPKTIDIELWLNVYDKNRISYWSNKEHAEFEGEVLPGRFACMHITRTITEGEGL